MRTRGGPSTSPAGTTAQVVLERNLATLIVNMMPTSVKPEQPRLKTQPFERTPVQGTVPRAASKDGHGPPDMHYYGNIPWVRGRRELAVRSVTCETCGYVFEVGWWTKGQIDNRTSHCRRLSHGEKGIWVGSALKQPIFRVFTASFVCLQCRIQNTQYTIHRIVGGGS